MSSNKQKDVPKLERLSINFTKWLGSPASVVIHTIFFIASFSLWFFGVDLQTILLALTTVVSLEAIYLALFIQMTVNRNTESLEEVEEDVAEIAEDVDDIEKNIDHLEETVDELDEDLDVVQKAVQNIDSDIDSVQAGILDLDSDIVRVQAGVSDLDKDMDTVHAGIKDLDADIEEMSEEEEAEKQTSNTTDISTSLKNIHSALNKLAEEIERLKK